MGLGRDCSPARATTLGNLDISSLCTGLNAILRRDCSPARSLIAILSLLNAFPKNLFTMEPNMFLLIDVGPDAFGQQSKSFKACSSDNFGTWLLQVLSPLVTMRPTASTKVELEGVVGGHSVCGVHPGGSKQVVRVTLVSGEKLDRGKAGTDLAHALHVEGSLNEGKVSAQRQGKPTGDAPILRIKRMTSFLGQLSGLLLLGHVSSIHWLAKGRLATFGRQVGRNDKMMFQGVPSVAKLFLEVGDQIMAKPICSGSLFGKQICIAVAHPPIVVVASIDGRLVGQVGFHPDHFQKTMSCLQPGSSGTVDGMPKEAIGRWAMPGAFIETRGNPKVVTHKDGISFGMPKGLQDGSGLSSRDSLLARRAAERVPKVIKVKTIGVGQNAGKTKPTSPKHRVTGMLSPTAIACKDGSMNREPPSPGDLELKA